MNAIREQLAALDWSRPIDEIAATLVEAGFRLRDLSDAGNNDDVNLTAQIHDEFFPN